MVRATLRVTLPDDLWIRRVSVANPGAEYRLLSGLPTADGSVELGEVRADDPAAAVSAVRDDPAVASYDLLGVDGRRAVAAYHTTDRTLYELSAGGGVPVEYPVVVRDGRATLSFTTTREGLARVTAMLRERGTPHELRRLTASGVEPPESILTDRQREAVTTALRRGYYDVPRAASLADVAARLDVDPSTASGILRRAERRLLAWHFGDDDDG